MKCLILLVLLSLITLLARGQELEMQQIGKIERDAVKVEGGVQYIKLDNGFRLWTKRVGEGPIKILLVHGGPGYTHECLECFESFFPEDAYQIIYYDQLGSYLSDQPNDPSLWRIERFCEEIEQIRQSLELDNFYLYGFSWGSMLAIEYALKYQNHLKGLILSNMTASLASYEAYLNQLREQLPPRVLEQLEACERSGSESNPEYEKLLFEHIYKHYICRLDPWPEPLLRTMRHYNKKVCDEIFGANEFVVTGNCKHWNRWDDLAKIDLPTLVIGARYDTINPKDIEKMAMLILDAKVKICDNGSHLSMYDDQDEYFKALHAFIDSVEYESTRK
jgi:proline iminopeptidase